MNPKVKILLVYVLAGTILVFFFFNGFDMIYYFKPNLSFNNGEILPQKNSTEVPFFILVNEEPEINGVISKNRIQNEYVTQTMDLYNNKNVNTEQKLNTIEIEQKKNNVKEIEEINNKIQYELNTQKDLTKPKLNFEKCKCKLINRNSTPLEIQVQEIDPYFNKTTKQVLEESHPNLPLNILLEKQCCGSLPAVTRIKWSANIWQVLTTASGTRYSLYAAFYDNRPHSAPKPVIRILLLKDRKDVEDLYCNIWFSARESSSSKVISQGHIDYQELTNTRLLPFLVTCPLAAEDVGKIPLAVSLTESPCDIPNNLLKVVGDHQRNKTTSTKASNNENAPVEYNVAVCGPALYYFNRDFSKRLVDWLETVKAIGVSKVFFYETDVHPNVKKVLDYYSSNSDSFVSLMSFTYPEPYINDPSLRSLWTDTERPSMFALENIYFTDCVLRHKDEFRFLAHIDPDEMPIISGNKTISSFISEEFSRNFQEIVTEYQMLSTYYPENRPPGPAAKNITESAYILRHNMHFEIMTDHLSPGLKKSIYDTEFVNGVYSHGSLLCNTGRCGSKAKALSLDKVHLAHYRRTCDSVCESKEKFIENNSILIHKEIITNNVLKILKILLL